MNVGTKDVMEGRTTTSLEPPKARPTLCNALLPLAGLTLTFPTTNTRPTCKPNTYIWELFLYLTRYCRREHFEQP